MIGHMPVMYDIFLCSYLTQLNLFITWMSTTGFCLIELRFCTMLA